MSGTPYKVKKGDSLSKIAREHLGDPGRWQELLDFNNSPAISRLTGTKIVDPNMIFVGQTLYIPGKHSAPHARMTVGSPAAPRSTPPLSFKQPHGLALSKMRSIPLKYSLDDLPSITVISPTHVATISLKGSLTLQKSGSVDFVTVTKTGYELEAKNETDLLVGKLVSGSTVGYNPATNELTYEFGITAHSRKPGALSTKTAVGMSTKTGLPAVKGTIMADKIQGSIGGHAYVVADLSVEIEMTPRPPSAKPMPAPAAQPNKGWVYLKAAGLIVGAAVVVVVVVGDDLVGVVADDIPGFALASTMFVTGVGLIKSVRGGKPIRADGLGVDPNQI